MLYIFSANITAKKTQNSSRKRARGPTKIVLYSLQKETLLFWPFFVVREVKEMKHVQHMSPKIVYREFFYVLYYNIFLQCLEYNIYNT